MCVRSDCGHMGLKTLFQVGPEMGPEVGLEMGPRRDRLPPGLIFFTAPPVMLFSMLCLVILSFVCSSYVLSHTQTPESPWGAPGGSSGGRSASHTASTVEGSHAVRRLANERHVWTLGPLWETPECPFHAAFADRELQNLSAYLSVPVGSDAHTDFTDPMESGAHDSAFKFIPDLWVTEIGRDGRGGSGEWPQSRSCHGRTSWLPAGNEVLLLLTMRPSTRVGGNNWTAARLRHRFQLQQSARE